MKAEDYRQILIHHAIPGGKKLLGGGFVFQQENGPKHNITKHAFRLPFRERSLSLWSCETLANDLMVCPGGVRRWKRNWGGLKTNLIRPPSSEWKWKNRIRFGGVGMMVGWLDDAI